MIRLRPQILLLMAAGLLASCATTEDSQKGNQKKQLSNPGDELSSRPWAQGTRSSHFATPFGLPMSH